MAQTVVINANPLTTVQASVATAVNTPTTIGSFTSSNSFIMVQNLSTTHDMFLGIINDSGVGLPTAMNLSNTQGILIPRNGGSIRFDNFFIPTGTYRILWAGASAPTTVQPFICIYN
jgi:hypothetical protein